MSPVGGLADLGVKRLVLQPTSGWPSLRRTLLLNGWTITDEVIHSEAGWLYITLAAELQGGEAPTDDQVLARTLLGPGALMASAQGSRAEAELLRFWMQRHLEHYRTRRAGVLKGLEGKRERLRGVGALADFSGGRGRVGGQEESSCSGGSEIVLGNPGNLGPQSLQEVDSRIRILSEALGALQCGGSGQGDDDGG